MPEERPVGEEFVPETHDALKRLSYALVNQLESPNRESWTQLEFTATRAVLAEYGESQTMRMTVWQPQGDFPLIPRPETTDACADLDRVSTLGQRPRWRSVRLLLRRVDGEVSFQCWWTYDPPHNSPERTKVVE
jgi:hypothetical protein